MPTYTRPSVTIDDSTVSEIRSIASELERLQPMVALLGERFYRVRKSFNTQTHTAGFHGEGLGDDEFAWLMQETGLQGAYDAAMVLCAPLVFATECTPGDKHTPDWYEGMGR